MAHSVRPNPAAALDEVARIKALMAESVMTPEERIADLEARLRQTEIERDVFKAESRRLAWPTDAQKENDNLRIALRTMGVLQEELQAKYTKLQEAVERIMRPLREQKRVGEAKWLVVIVREGEPEVTPFEEEDFARAYFNRWSNQWSESFLTKVVIGPLT